MQLPDTSYMNICKVFQEVYKNKFTPNIIQSAEVGSRGKSMICQYMITPLPELTEHLTDLSFSYYDAAVYDAVYTIYRTNARKFSLTDVIRIMSGDARIRFYHSKNGVQKREQRLRDSLYRLMHTTITIDYTEEVQKRHLTDENGVPLQGIAADYLLPIATEKDSTTFWFLEGRELPLYQYAQDIRQIISIPTVLLSPAALLQTRFSNVSTDSEQTNVSVSTEDTAELQEIRALLKRLNFSTTDELMLLKRLLIQRLEIMGNTKNNFAKNVIRYYGIRPEEGIFPAASIRKENFAQEEPFTSDRGKIRSESRGWKNKVHNVNEKICAILDAYKKCGYITDYTLLRNGTRGLVRGIEIIGDVKKLR